MAGSKQRVQLVRRRSTLSNDDGPDDRLYCEYSSTCKEEKVRARGYTTWPSGETVEIIVCDTHAKEVV